MVDLEKAGQIMKVYFGVKIVFLIDVILVSTVHGKMMIRPHRSPAPAPVNLWLAATTDG